jgi:hypothetical protein
MIVRRLNALYVWVVAAVVRAFARPPAVSAPLAVGGESASPRRLATRTNWLEDGRRLRTHLVPRPAIARPSTETVRQILRDPHWASAFDATRLSRPPRASNPLESRALPEGGEAAPTRPLATPGPATNAGSAAEEAQRRLTLMRDLVQRGLYNEGFTPHDAPDYYRPRPSGGDAEPPSL